MKGLIVVIFFGFGSKINAQAISKAAEYKMLEAIDHTYTNLDSALYCINEAIEIDSNSNEIYSIKVKILWSLNRNIEALKVAKKMSILNGRKLLIEGMAYEKMGSLKEAKEVYKKILYDWPKSKQEENEQSKVEYALLTTIVYGKESGLKELNKVNSSQFTMDGIDLIGDIRTMIKNYKGNGFSDSAFLPPKPEEPIQVQLPSSTITPHELKRDSSYFIITISDNFYNTDFQNAKQEFKTIDGLEAYFNKQKLLIKGGKLVVITNTETTERIKPVITLLVKYNFKHFELETESERQRINTK